MDEKELQEIVEKHSSDFKIFIENESLESSRKMTFPEYGIPSESHINPP